MGIPSECLIRVDYYSCALLWSLEVYRWTQIRKLSEAKGQLREKRLLSVVSSYIVEEMLLIRKWQNGSESRFILQIFGKITRNFWACFLINRMEMIIVPNLLDYDGDKASMCSVNNQHPRECKAQKFDFLLLVHSRAMGASKPKC